jgi:hypothetical protein
VSERFLSWSVGGCLIRISLTGFICPLAMSNYTCTKFRQQAAIEAMRTGVLVPQDIYSVEELAELLSYMEIETIEAVAPLLKHKLEQIPSR